MQSLFSRKGKIQILFELYNKHRHQCMQVLNSNTHRPTGFFVDMQIKNNDMIHLLETAVKDAKMMDGCFQPHLRVETALEQLKDYRQQFYARINPTPKFSLQLC